MLQVSDGLVTASTAAATPMQIRAMSSSVQMYGGIVYTRSRKGRSHTPFSTAAAVARATSTDRSSSDDPDRTEHTHVHDACPSGKVNETLVQTRLDPVDVALPVVPGARGRCWRARPQPRPRFP